MIQPPVCGLLRFGYTEQPIYAKMREIRISLKGKMTLQRKKGIRTDQIAKRQRREMITSGIYKISRNPAFLGFDCVYLGILLMFFNWILLAASVFAALMLHLQILQEEKYLPAAFGEAYISYKKCVRRYLGRKE